jgi:HSP20 family protein
MSKATIPVKKTATPGADLPGVWRNFRNEIEGLFNRFDTDFLFPSVTRLFEIEPFWGKKSEFTFTVPPVDVTEDAKGYKVTAELPGLDEKNIAITLTGDQLVLKGEKIAEKEEKEKNYYLSERNYGSFQRSFRLPEGVDRDKIEAAFTKGVLTITLPKTAEAQVPEKKIEVKAA